MVCPSCNTPNRDDAKFCKRCGQPLRAAQPAQALPEVPNAVEAPTVVATATPGDVQQPATGAQEEQAIQNASPVQTASPEQQEQSTQAGEQEDVSMAPTLTLTPDRVVAYRHRFEEKAEHHTPEPETSESQSAEAPTVLAGSPADAGAQAAYQQQDSNHYDTSNTPTGSQQDIAEAPTVWMGHNPYETNPYEAQAQNASQMPISSWQPASDSEASAPPPPELPENESATSAAAAGITAADENLAEQSSEAQPAEQQTSETASEVQPQQSSETNATASPEQSSEFPVLAVGILVNGRYEVTAVTSDGEQEHVYQVIDRQGYQRCWNCGSEQNHEGDEFCIDCGASLLNVPYIMREYPSAQAGGVQSQEASVLTGNIVNTFVDQGHTYAIEQIQAEASAFPNGVQLVAASYSDAGNVRRSEPNEDSTLVLMLQRVHESFSEPVGVFIVADGLGGHDNGQVASRMTINIIAERMVRDFISAPLATEKAGEQVKPMDEDEMIGLFHSAIEEANLALCQKNQQDKTDMGSTITGFMIAGEHAYIINVGDSRTYMVRGGQLYQLTTDHSLVGQLVASGLIEPDDVYTHPQRSQIFRSLGDKPNTQIDVFKQQLHPGDILLSCSDGLWEMVRNPQIESILNNAPDPQTACAQLIDTANTNGGEDNVSAVVVFVR
ncbi:MAG TPA: protein phosphatase 2C domain-containing protein [Ktedonobacteraceae bacterium]|jgi:serine/threonine protein phosphatase PrpC/rRNA maturation endonuclease Nob1|nr:protein phosphatase 2C domain-containing protein [Ktedonobacteraceae bacterium]